LRLAITGGGTGGHVYPAVAVFEEFKCRAVDLSPLWIGSSSGLEREAARDLDIPFAPVTVGKLRRYVSLRTVPDAARVPVGVFQALRILRRFRPDVIFSTGGYIGVPVVIAGRILGIPSLTHEQTAALGLATRINARFTDCIALSYPSTPHPKVRNGASVIVTGNPIRSELRLGTSQQARAVFKLAGGRPLLYVTGGAQGAKGINDTVAGCLPQLLALFEIVHQTGPDELNGGFSKLKALKHTLDPDARAGYQLVERVASDELAHLYAAVDLIVGRSGAGTVAELAALGLPSILVPLPGADEARRNAEMLRDAGAAIVIDQSDLTPERLLQEVESLAHDPDRLASMAAAARTVAADRPAARLVDAILSLARPR
jgi:UDP-N-acetylglucosamine--N-acetylmuramyl-(pentapeptide) pyrophosphoryl-undecaprenol N-acetylglucosamine transferase